MFQELNSKAEGKFNRLKAQAKTKITTLNKELEKLREEHGAPPLDISAQVSSLSGTHVHVYIHIHVHVIVVSWFLQCMGYVPREGCMYF